MSVFFRGNRGAEERSISSLPWSHGGDVKGTGSMESQLGLVPVYAAVRLIADSIASMPLQQYRKTSDGRSPMPLASVFEAPANHGTRVDWIVRCMSSLLLRGNAYGLQVGLGEPGTRTPNKVEWLHPDKVQLRDGRWFYNGSEVNEAELLHIPAVVLPGERLGLSPIGACSVTMTTGLETQRFMKDWYRNKAVPGMVFKNEEAKLDSDVADKVKERLRSTLRAGDPFVTGKDWTVDVVKLSADDAGFVSSAKLNATQIANIFGIPPEMIGGETGKSMTYSTVELNQIHFVTNTLRPWLVRLEAAFSALLPKPQYVKFNVDSMIRADTKTRYEVHQIARTIGLNNIDEIRAIEDLDPLPDNQGQDYSPIKAAPAPAPKENP